MRAEMYADDCTVSNEGLRQAMRSGKIVVVQLVVVWRGSAQTTAPGHAQRATVRLSLDESTQVTKSSRLLRRSVGLRNALRTD